MSVFTLLLVGVFVLGGLSITSEEATASDTVIVSAEVEAWVTISIDEDSLALGNMVDTAGVEHVVEGQTNVNAGTNHPDGWSMTISGAKGGLENSEDEENVTISTVKDKESLTAGIDGYGALAVHDTETHNDSVTINEAYDGGDGDDEVNSIDTTAALATATEAMSTGTSVFDLHVHAASDDENPVGTYEDTITLTITAGTT